MKKEKNKVNVASFFRYLSSFTMAVPDAMVKLFAAVDKNKDKYIDNLSKAVAIKSVSAWPQTRPEIKKMMTV